MFLKLLFFVIAAQCVIGFAGVPRVIGKARPCAFRDYSCIRDNFAANSQCKRRTRPVQWHHRVPWHRFEAPFFNASYIDNDLIISGMPRCFVSEFFYNVNRDTAVLGIDCPWLTFASNRTVLQHRPLQEDSVYSYTINGTYPLIRLTSIFPKVDVLDICHIGHFTHAEVVQLPKFNINPNDRATKNYLTRDLSQLMIYERETFFYRASLLARHFINTQLCDFGCN